jgi:hypothetical protein
VSNLPMINRQKSVQRLFRATVWLEIVITFAFLSVGVTRAQAPLENDRDLMAAFNAAITDAAVFRFSNLRPLYPLTFDPVTNRATVVTVTDWKGYHKGPLTLERDVWVTAAPEVKNVCQNFRGDVALRLKQLLGLRPTTSITHFVELSIHRDDVIRPTTDPETTTTFPCACPITPKCGLEFPATVRGGLDRHILWIANMTFKSYVISEVAFSDSGYPWTRLGYTYDWRPGSNKYGASEYVVRSGAKITVLEEPYPIETYCKPK